MGRSVVARSSRIDFARSSRIDVASAQQRRFDGSESRLIVQAACEEVLYRRWVIAIELCPMNPQMRLKIKNDLKEEFAVTRGTTSVSCSIAILAVISANPASADTLRSDVRFNTGAGEKTASQPAGGVEVAYQVPLKGGDLDGCTVDIVESLYGRDDGSWGIFDIEGEVTCDRGGFSYTSSGAWDGSGFHAAGEIAEGSGSGEFEGISGRAAQLNGTSAAAGNGTFDISYELVFDTGGG